MSNGFYFLKINGKVERFEFTYDHKDEVLDGTSKHTWNNIKSQQFLSVKEIAAHQLTQLTSVDLLNVKNTKKEDLIMYHHGYGTYLRNSYGLWHPINPFVIKNDLGDGHPDGLSMLAIYAIHEMVTKPNTAFDNAMATVREKKQ